MSAPPKQRGERRSLSAIFAIPAAIAAISLFGLVSALTGDGVRNILSWIGLGVPVLVALWAWRRRDKIVKIYTNQSLGNKIK